MGTAKSSISWKNIILTSDIEYTYIFKSSFMLKLWECSAQCETGDAVIGYTTSQQEWGALGKQFKQDRATRGDSGSFFILGIYRFSVLSCHPSNAALLRCSSSGISSLAVLTATDLESGSCNHPEEGWQHWLQEKEEFSSLQLSHWLRCQDSSTWPQDEPWHWSSPSS